MNQSVVAPESAKNMTPQGHHDLNGKMGIQVMVANGHAYIGHAFDGGVSVVDVRDPRAPRLVNTLPIHKNSWSIHLQTHGDLMLVIEEFNFKAVFTQAEYYARSIDGINSADFGVRGEDYSAGMRVYDISQPSEPRPIGFMPVEGLGLHRIWWVGDRYAYASAILDGFTDHIFIVIDMQDPTRPREVGRWWIPGMWADGGETHDFKGRVGLHHAVISGDTAYGCWRDGGLTLLDIADKSQPKLISHLNWSPPFAGGTHSALPLPDRDLLVVADEAVLNIDEEPFKHTWMIDIRVPEKPVQIATFPVPDDQDYFAKGGHFGPHNLHENRPGSFQSSTTIFATYQNAGIRVFDISNPFRPVETGYFVPAPPAVWNEARRGRKKVIHTCDVFVEKDGLVYLTDYDAGLHIVQWDGA
ncbi:hypothetical protein [Paraburkholderia sp. J12]|uniref:LVIVD repeat-containing protein n=1 Tax=Paraburkholderia sp. J12 TaxID=2805432 RepID=UPI002ABE1953|nr:hypothetical protein [Paraburkholderia sp. J12]